MNPVGGTSDLDPQTSDPNSDHYSYPPYQAPLQPQPQLQPQRRPRGFAVAAATNTPTTVSSSGGVGGKGKKEREKERERTKLRERHRRAITSRMLAGLRQYGNFPLPARADMNDVLAALAREAGWTVDPDGTTYRQCSPTSQLATYQMRSVESPMSTTSLRGSTVKASFDCRQPPVLRFDDNLSPASFDSVVIAESHTDSETYTNGPFNSADCLEAEQLMHDSHSCKSGNDFTETPYIPVYVMLAADLINSFCQLSDPEGIRRELGLIKSLNVDGVVVYCWWAIVEHWNPQKYVWSGYKDLFNTIREFKLKLQVVIAFHELGGNHTSNVAIPLPQWVLEIGKDNPDIFFTDREGRRNTECLSWGVDKERVLSGRTGIEVYFDFMRSFRTEFDDLFAEGLIYAVEIGLGASGELKYPSFPERMGWRYPGIGEFQCYDKYLQENLRKAAALRGHSFWARIPENAGHYNCRPHDTDFFRERGDYDSYYGRFFLNWYSQSLVDHADNVLSLASLAFGETQIIVKIPTVYWWYRTVSHAAELTSGYYNSANRDGYSPVLNLLKKYLVTVKIVCTGLAPTYQENDDALADLEGLSWQVTNSAWDRGLTLAGENTPTCYDREGLLKLVEQAKPRNDPDHRHLSFYVYQHSSPLSEMTVGLAELDFFVKCMHGKNA